MRDCYLSLGANIGDREATIRAAFEELSTLPLTELTRISSFYETTPWGKTDQPSFINAAAKIITDLSPEELLAHILEIEKKLGRVRREKWGSRKIDIDILHMDGITLSSPNLTLPHPYMFKRRFVMVPLDEIAPFAKINGRTMQQYLLNCPDTGYVCKMPGSPRDFRCAIMVCVDENWGIGKNNKLLFDLPEDKAQFKEKTIGQTVVMGRKTMDTLPQRRPLKGRFNIVLSTTLPDIDDFAVCNNIDDVFRCISENAQRKVFIIGGGMVYRAFLPYVTDAYVTKVHATKDADAFLPDLSKHDFTLKSCTPANDNHISGKYEFLHYVKG